MLICYKNASTGVSLEKRSFIRKFNIEEKLFKVVYMCREKKYFLRKRVSDIKLEINCFYKVGNA